jgi:hypothetical protein
MAWDSKSARRRQNSGAAASLSRPVPLHTRQQSKQTVVPRSQHVADPSLQAFLSPSFDAAEYWNLSLPPLQTSASGRQSQDTMSLADLSSQSQITISHLNAHTTRLTGTLTQLTDDILRSGSRLAYEVELLRGETLSFSEVLMDGLYDDITNFVPNGLGDPADRKPPVAMEGTDTARRSSIAGPLNSASLSHPETEGVAEPPYISQLRTLVLVRSRLDSVIKAFGDAMEFVFPPSELSVSSSFLSVSAPEPGAEMHSTEEKGQQVLQKLRDEISVLLSGSPDPIKGIEEAARRIEELKELTMVWKGTAEEKGRTKFIESLAKMVEDRHRDLLRELEAPKGRQSDDGNSRRANADGGSADSKGYSSAYGIISQLQKIRSGL